MRRAGELRLSGSTGRGFDSRQLAATPVIAQWQEQSTIPDSSPCPSSHTSLSAGDFAHILEEAMPDPLSAVNLRRTPQWKSADPRQIANNAGGQTFGVTPIERLRRFLVLGTDGGTYYTTERALTARTPTSSSSGLVTTRSNSSTRLCRSRPVVGLHATTPPYSLSRPLPRSAISRVAAPRWPRYLSSLVPAPTCSRSPATSSSSGAGVADCDGRSATGT